MSFTDRIFSLVWDISGYFYDAYLEVRDWTWPLSYLQYPMYALYSAFLELLSPVANLGNWISGIEDQVSSFLDQSEILELLGTWINYAEDAWSWIEDAVPIIWYHVGSWWESMSLTVEGWIQAAKDYALDLVFDLQLQLWTLVGNWDDFWTTTLPSLISDLGGLRSAWESFTSSTLPGLATWTGVGDLVETTIRSFFPFYDELVSLWGEIREFASDPEAYLLAKIELLLIRYW